MCDTGLSAEKLFRLGLYVQVIYRGEVSDSLDLVRGLHLLLKFTQLWNNDHGMM